MGTLTTTRATRSQPLDTDQFGNGNPACSGSVGAGFSRRGPRTRPFGCPVKPARIRHKKHHLPRLCYLGQVCVAITACIEAGRPIFQKSEIVAAFTDNLRDAVERNDCVVPVYCFMPEHLHAVIKGQSEVADAWAAISRFKQRTGYWLSKTSSASWNQTYTITSSAAISHLRIRSDISSTIPAAAD
jgi:REP element-mobilizing transposase RayT